MDIIVIFELLQELARLGLLLLGKPGIILGGVTQLTGDDLPAVL